MSDDDRLLASVMAQEAGLSIERCECGLSANLCRVSLYLKAESCCRTCSH